MAESPTFRDLVIQIGGLRSVVYIMWTPRLPNRLGAAFLNRMTLAPDGTRYVWIVVRRSIRPDLVSVLGHELQHALEVLSSDAVTSREIDSLFSRLDERKVGPPYETRRAQEVQRLIARELEAARSELKTAKRAEVPPGR